MHNNNNNNTSWWSSKFLLRIVLSIAISNYFYVFDMNWSYFFFYDALRLSNLFMSVSIIYAISSFSLLFIHLQAHSRYSPAENQFGTYSPSTKHRYSADMKKFSTLDSRRYSPDNRRYSPDISQLHSQDNSHLHENPYSHDIKRISPENIVVRTESRASRASVDSTEKRYSPSNHHQQQQVTYTPQSQKRFLHNLAEGNNYQGL